MNKMNSVKLMFVMMLAGLTCCWCLEMFDDNQNIMSNEIVQWDEHDEDISTSIRLRNMFQRGKEMLRLLPKLGMILMRKLVDHIPTPREVLNFGKQTIIGLPQEVVAYAINAVCSTAVGVQAVKPIITPNIKSMKYLLITPDNEEIFVSLSNSKALWNHPRYRMSWKLVVVVTGWNSNINVTNEALETLYEAYRCRDNYNFVIIDTAQFVDTLYTWSAFSTKPVGQIIGEALVNLTKYVDLEDVHLIGHSLGAHICGEAGRTYTKFTNRSLPRITGLDPARPCFNEGERLDGLQRGDAEFVDIIHTNSGILGMKDPIGDIDFYPNGRDPLQPGCWSIFCAHSRSYQYFAETVYPGNEQNFIATRCNSLTAYKLGRCGGRQVPMGIATPTSARGSYYLETNNKSPFGKHRKSTSWWGWFDYTKRAPKCKLPRS